jgi:hypothetical protein
VGWGGGGDVCGGGGGESLDLSSVFRVMNIELLLKRLILC